MRRIISITLALLLLALSQGVGQERSTNPDEKRDNARPLSPADKDAGVQAIVDEMYVHDLQGYVADVGKQVSGSEYQLAVYFKPTVNGSNAGWAIYKLMPYGEVLRMFTLQGSGLAVLSGKLRDRFPPTQPSYLTVYMDDDELCQIKREWQKGHFVIELKPSTDRVAEARVREGKRNSP